MGKVFSCVWVNGKWVQTVASQYLSLVILINPY
jgi:hypothetical protein